MPTQGRRWLGGSYSRWRQPSSAGYYPVPHITRSLLPAYRLCERAHRACIATMSLLADGGASSNSGNGAYLNRQHSSLLKQLAACRTLSRLGMSLAAAASEAATPAATAGPPRAAPRVGSPVCTMLVAETKSDMNRSTLREAATEPAATAHAGPSPCNPKAFGGLLNADGRAIGVRSEPPLNSDLFEPAYLQWSQELQQPQQKHPDHTCMEGQHNEAFQKGQSPNGIVPTALAAPAGTLGLAPTDGHAHSRISQGGPEAIQRRLSARSNAGAECGGTASSSVASASAAGTAAANGASRRDTLVGTPNPNNASPSGTPAKTTAVGIGTVAVVPACSSCSLSTASVWKKWLLLLCEADPQRRQELLLKFPPICKKHGKNRAASGHGDFFVSFRQLLRLLEAAALHPHATEASVSILRKRVRLGVERRAPKGTSAATAGAGGMTELSGALDDLHSATAARAARHLAYVEDGLAMLALEKGAQLMQSLRDFDCADSFLLEATAEGAPLRAGRAAPRWSFTAIEGPLHDPSSRQKSVWKQLESGSLLILKPVDEASALLAKELRLLHGDSFDFSYVIAQAAAATAELTVNATSSRPAVLEPTLVYKGDEKCLRRTQQQPLPLVLQELLKSGRGKHRVRCVVCGRSLLVSADELIWGTLSCADCEVPSTAVTAAETVSTEGTSGQTQFCGAPCVEGSPAGDVKQHEQPDYGDVRRVLKQLETATSWGANRFALASPTFIASVCSSSKLPNIKVCVHPFPESTAPGFGSCGNSNAAPFEKPEIAPGPSEEPAKPRLQGVEKEGFTLSAGARFWAMPVSFIAAVHTRQVEALARLAESTSLQLLPADNGAIASTAAESASAAAKHLCENRILEVLTAREGDNTYSSVQTSTCLPSLVIDRKTESSHRVLDSQAIPALHWTGLSDAAASAAAQAAEEGGAALETSFSFLTPRQREAVSAATSQGTRIVTIEGPPGTGKTAVAASIVREWLSRCTYTSDARCEDTKCACRTPIFVAAGTHAALRSLKNKLDQEGVETVRLSDEAAVLEALQAATPPRRAPVLLDTIYQGHRLSKLKLHPRRLLVDESSQLTEFAGLGSLVNGADVVVLIGDERQLPPPTALPASSSSRSFFSALKGGACRSVLLNLQFRMPPLLAAFISSHFYEGKLLTHPSRAGPSSFQECPLPSKQPLQRQQQIQQRPLQMYGGVDLAPLLDSPQHLSASPHFSRTACQDTSERCTRLGETASLHCRDSIGGKMTVAVKSQKKTQNECRFPWPDGSEGDRDLAKRLVEQLVARCKSAGQASPSSRWVEELHRYSIPDVLPILFLDTSPWASGPSRRLAKITLPPSTAEGEAPTIIPADAARTARSADGCKPLVKSLPAEQRIKSSLQNPLEAFMVYRCIDALVSCGASKHDIAVLTPYQAQAQLLSRVLHPVEGESNARGIHKRSNRLSFVQPALDVLDERCRPHPQVFTVDGFQGHEREYIILSTVKGSRKSLREFFLFDPRRINVALSRASKGLIIVGNAHALADASPTWSSFLLFLRTLGAALPLDHPSLRSILTQGMLLPRTKPFQCLKQEPLRDLNPSKRMPEEGEQEGLETLPYSVETSK